MTLTPVHDLTSVQAVSELEKILDTKPAEDQTLELIHWHQAHDARIQELEAWILMHPTEPTTEPAPEAPVPTKHSPAHLLKLKTETYRRVHALLVADPGNKKHRDHLNTIRYAIRDLVQRIGCALPDLPQPPESPFGQRRKTPKAPAHRPTADPQQVPPVVAAPSVEQRLSPARSISAVRRDIWHLMAGLEDLSPEDRAALTPELALLDAAAHAAHNLAAGRLEVL